MPTSQKVTVRICDMPYTITTDEPESYLQELGKQIDARMRELMADNPRVSTNMAAVLTAITLADQAHKSEEAADNLRVKLRDYLAENESLQKQLEQATSTKGRKQS
jgi:cell division protein ZapA